MRVDDEQPASVRETRPTWTRRRVLVVLSAALVASGAVAGRVLGIRRRHLASALGATSRASEAAPLDDSVADTVTVFTGALFGRVLSEEDHAEIVERVRYAAGLRAAWRARCARLATTVDDCACAAGAPSFVSASAAERERIVEEIMLVSPYSLASRLRALFSDHHDHHRQLKDFCGALGQLYRTSGVPWRARGYTSWPGIPGNETDSNRAAAMEPCGKTRRTISA